jgi:hypothetical protein
MEMKGNSGRGAQDFLMECLVLNLLHEDGMFLTSRQIEAAYHTTRLHEREG